MRRCPFGLAATSQSGMRFAFTLTELLVVVAIVGVAVGLLLPSVQATRERARASSCRNNLLHVHLGIEAYESAFRVFPAGTVTDRLPARMFSDGKDHSWLVQIRPFFDGGFAFAEKWSPVHSAYHPRNWSLVTHASPFLACPSSPLMHRNSSVVPLSYAGIHDGRNVPISTKSRGFFVANRFLRRAEIVDGLSHTLQLGEIRVNTCDTFFWIAGNQSTLRTTALPMEVHSEAGRSNETRTNVAYGRFAAKPAIRYAAIVQRVGAKADPLTIATALFEMELELLESNELSMDEGIGRAADSEPLEFPVPMLGAGAAKAMPLGSPHGPLVHGVFADGRVVAINQAIDDSLFSQLGIRDDGQPLSMPLVEHQ